MSQIIQQLAARHAVTELETGRVLWDVNGLAAELRRLEHERSREATRENEGGDD